MDENNDGMLTKAGTDLDRDNRRDMDYDDNMRLDAGYPEDFIVQDAIMDMAA